MAKGVKVTFHSDATMQGDLKAFGALYKSSDPPTQKALRAALKAAALPMGQDAIKGGTASLPRHGGLQALFAATTSPSVQLAAAGTSPRVTVKIASKGAKHDVASLERGRLRHPVFARGQRYKETGLFPSWANTKIQPHQFSKAFATSLQDHQQEIIDAITTAVTTTVKETEAK